MNPERAAVHRSEPARMRIAVGIATAGRRETLSETIRELAKQRRPADLVVICPKSLDDVDQQVLKQLPCPWKLVSAPPGLTRQRNAILREIWAMDAIVFFDDDFFPSPNYLENAEAILQRHADVVAMSGTPIVDGINGPGLTQDEARALITAATPAAPGALPADYGTYGCNMVFRLAPVRDHQLAFDEALPMYGWQEDIDFSRQLAPWGRIVRAEGLAGVHLGAKRGRTSGVKFGYSQVANPIYLMRKGTVSLSFGGKTMLKNVAANFLKAFRPEAHVDRGGRLKGNALATWDFIRGVLHPGRIFEID
jgi:GT2 family glycosyltransferase